MRLQLHLGRNERVGADDVLLATNHVKGLGEELLRGELHHRRCLVHDGGKPRLHRAARGVVFVDLGPATRLLPAVGHCVDSLLEPSSQTKIHQSAAPKNL